MSHTAALMVQEDMIRSAPKASIQALRGCSVLAAWLVLCSGCGSRLDVLHEVGGSTSTGGSAVGAASSGGAASDAGAASMGGGPPVSGGASQAGAPANGAGTATGGAGESQPNGGISVCTLPVPDSFLTLTIGQPCIDKDICEPQSCAGMGAPSESNVAAFAACRNHKVQVVSMSLLDAEPGTVPSSRGDGVSWDDCEAALESGLTGQGCTWPSQTCIRRTSDPCCLEGAECLAPNNLLHRVRVCAPGCEDAAPDAPTPVVTDCTSAREADTCHRTPACTGDFICYRDLSDQNTVSDYTETSQLNGAMWCGGGLLVGGYGLTWGL